MNEQALKSPAEFIKNFKDEDSYRVWCHTQKLEELEIHLEKLAEEEIYDACIVARDVIKAKKTSRDKL